MNDRERLIELLDTAKIKQAFRSSTGALTGLYHAKAVDSEFVKPLAELLIANGVIVQKHGRWIAVPSSDMVAGKAFECSECKKMRWGSFKPNYCPNCGADMREAEA